MTQLTAPAGAALVVAPRTGPETPSLLPEVDQARSAAQAAVLSAPDALAAAGVAPLARPGAGVAIATAGQIAGGNDDRLHPIKRDLIRVSRLSGVEHSAPRPLGHTRTQAGEMEGSQNKTLQTNRGLERLSTASAGLPAPFVAPIKDSAVQQNSNMFI